MDHSIERLGYVALNVPDLAQATDFQKSTRAQRRMLCCRSLKWSCLIAIPLICLVAFVVGLVLHLTGVLK